MSTGFNIDYKSILDSAMGQLKSIGLSNGSFGTTSSNGEFVNSIFGLAEDGYGAIAGNDQQRASAISGIVENLMGMLTSLGTKENSKATKEVKQNDKSATELEKKADKDAQATQDKIKEITGNIADNSSNVNDAIVKLQELGGENGQVAEAQKQLEEQLKIIQENQEILNSEDATKEEKEKALQALSGASATITGLLQTITEVQAQIEEQNTVVENSTNNVSTLLEESVNTITNGTSNLQSYLKEGGVQIGKNTTQTVTGTSNELVGAQATAMGTAANSNVFTSAIGQKLIRIGSDQTSAGGTRIQGAAKTLSSLTKAIGEMGSDLSSIADLTQSLGGIGDNVVALVGQYGSTLEPIITATGSWATVADVNTQFEDAIKEYSSKTGLDAGLEENASEAGEVPEGDAQPKTTTTNNNKEEVTTGNVKFEFDTNLFLDAFKTQG